MRWLLVVTFLFPSLSFANDELSSFLKSCALGTGFGAAAGAISLTFEDKPNDHTGNIARGASLGLYAGIVYGWLELQAAKKPKLEPLVPDSVQIWPSIEGQSVTLNWTLGF